MIGARVRVRDASMVKEKPQRIGTVCTGCAEHRGIPMRTSVRNTIRIQVGVGEWR